MAKDNYKSDEPCVACGHHQEDEQCYHHLFTRKVYPEFAKLKWNQISVCQSCHNLFHSRGIAYMAETFRSVNDWLHNNDWFLCPAIKKWRRVGF